MTPGEIAIFRRRTEEMRKPQNVMVMRAWPLWRTLPQPWGIPHVPVESAPRPVRARPISDRNVSADAVVRREHHFCRIMGAVERSAIERAAANAPVGPAHDAGRHAHAARPAGRMPEERDEIFAHPATVGLLLALFPPVGLTLLWATHRIPREGKIAISLIAALALSIVGVAFFFA